MATREVIVKGECESAMTATRSLADVLAPLRNLDLFEAAFEP